MVIGIDPGTSGGFAVLSSSGDVVVAQAFANLTERDIWNTLKEYSLNPDVGLAMIEQVGAMPGQGVTSMFTFGQSFGFLRGLLAASAVPYEFVRPQMWQKAFRLPTTKQAGDQRAKKNAHKARAQELFPSVRVTHGIADAMLIAEYARRELAARMLPSAVG